MGDAVALIMFGGVMGGLVGHTAGIRWYQRRLRRAARGAPRDQIAVATLERLARELDESGR